MEKVQEDLLTLIDHRNKGLLFEVDDYKVIIISNSINKNFELLEKGIGSIPDKCKTISFGH